MGLPCNSVVHVDDRFVTPSSLQADVYTMETKFDGVFAIGDASWLMLATDPPKPHPKAGEFSAAEGTNAAEMIEALVRGRSVEEARGAVGRTRDRWCYAEAGEGTGIPINFILNADGAPKFNTDKAKPEWYSRKELWLREVYRTYFGEELRIKGPTTTTGPTPPSGTGSDYSDQSAAK